MGRLISNQTSCRKVKIVVVEHIDLPSTKCGWRGGGSFKKNQITKKGGGGGGGGLQRLIKRGG